MKKILSPLVALGIIVFAIAGSASAQKENRENREALTAAQNYVISAKAGGVNYIEGQVGVLRKSGRSGLLIKGDRLEIGDKVSTGTSGKAEILLNPGSYIRLAENTDFEFENTSLNDLKLKLIRGSAMLEVFADNDFRVTVSTPDAQFSAIKSGVYRVDSMINGEASKIEVWKGKAQVGKDINATILKGGREVVVNDNQVATVVKFDRDEKDSLEIWSKARAKELAKLNAKLERRFLRDTLLSSFRGGRGWNMYDSFGLWVYDASRSYYCFLPFGYGWSSPYGYYYGRSIWNYGMPYAFYAQRPNWGNNNNNPNSNNGNRNGNNENVNRPIPNHSVVPPFERIQNNRDTGGFNDVAPINRKHEAPMMNTPSMPNMDRSIPRLEPKDN